jgi:hypothetical protein
MEGAIEITKTPAMACELKKRRSNGAPRRDALEEASRDFTLRTVQNLGSISGLVLIGY